MDKKEYVKTDNYKIICILQVFRELGELTGITFVYDIKKLRKRRGSFVPLNASKFIGNVETGVEPLDDEEVDVAIAYIAYFFKFDREIFARVLRNYASRIEPITIHENNGVQRRAKIVYEVMEEMKNEGVELMEF